MTLCFITTARKELNSERQYYLHSAGNTTNQNIPSKICNFKYKCRELRCKKL